MSKTKNEKEVQKLLKSFPCLTLIADNSKVKCSLSGHEMPCKKEAIQSYVRGKKFLKLQSREDSQFEKYKPHLVPSTKKYHEHQLFCNLTMCHVNKTVAHVERHVSGGKYRRALKRWEVCQANGTPYKPAHGRRKKQEPDIQKGDHSKGDVLPDGGETAEISDTDSLSDLYPAERMKGSTADASGDDDDGSDTGDSDFEFEDLEASGDQDTLSVPLLPTSTRNGGINSIPPQQQTTKPSQKRKQQTFTSKKMKKKKQKIG